MNETIRLNVAVFGSIFGISGMSHGFFEILQGYKPTPGLFIEAIGEAQRMWVHGNEPAFTLIPNFLISGIVSMLIGLSIIIWSSKYASAKHGAIILLSLFITLLLTGGGVAQALFFPWICLAASRINKPSRRKRELGLIGKHIARLWPAFLSSGATLLALALWVATTGFVPGVSDPERVLSIMLALLAAFVPLFALALHSGLLAQRVEGGESP